MIDALTSRWRWPIYALLVYLPVSGVAVLAAYPGRAERAVAILAKDFIFVIPAYLLFLGYFLRRRERLWFKGAPLVLIGLLALIVVIQAFNPDLPNHLVGLIGIKVWLFYIPLFFLGYWLVAEPREALQRPRADEPGRDRSRGRRAGGGRPLLRRPRAVGLRRVRGLRHRRRRRGSRRSSCTTAARSAAFPAPSRSSTSTTSSGPRWWRCRSPGGGDRGRPGSSSGPPELVFLLIFLAAMFSGVRLGFVVIPLLVAAIIMLAIRSAEPAAVGRGSRWASPASRSRAEPPPASAGMPPTSAA